MRSYDHWQISTSHNDQPGAIEQGSDKGDGVVITGHRGRIGIQITQPEVHRTVREEARTIGDRI